MPSWPFALHDIALDVDVITCRGNRIEHGFMGSRTVDKDARLVSVHQLDRLTQNPRMMGVPDWTIGGNRVDVEVEC